MLSLLPHALGRRGLVPLPGRRRALGLAHGPLCAGPERRTRRAPLRQRGVPSTCRERLLHERGGLR